MALNPLFRLGLKCFRAGRNMIPYHDSITSRVTYLTIGCGFSQHQGMIKRSHDCGSLVWKYCQPSYLS